ncbi:hypothetical protein [Roseivivax marinus]|uniref:hypothetical protein n=1 Tax=Roseivivax marinus TaxID=1379903 RepID=UPI00273D9815|nr:hypothetical protein [Roseivivax marinus]
MVLKVLSSKIAHKSDVGGGKVGLTPDTVGPALEHMVQGLAAQGCRTTPFSSRAWSAAASS